MLTVEHIDAIPQELKALRQWVGAEQKIPINPTTLAAASSTDPTTWGTFEEAVAGLEDGKYSHIGFVFTDTDPYVFIDLDAPKGEDKKTLPFNHPKFKEQDEKNLSWVKAFSSYTERSQSGYGYHIIIKANPVRAMKMAGTEIYFSERYAIFTGDVVAALPINERQEELDKVMTGMRIASHRPQKQKYVHSPYNPEIDAPIMAKLAVAANSAAIRELWEGKWKDKYPSQSEADHALLAHLCFYSLDDAQVVRIFRMSALGQRRKANNPQDPYVETSVAHIRAQQPPPIDFSKFKAALTQSKESMSVPSPTSPPPRVKLPSAARYPKPPGVLGQIASYIYDSSIRPVDEVSYAGAIAFGAGLVGRHFNISGTGLNQYVLLLAATGMGKEGASDGIDLLYSHIRPSVPEIETFRGPSNFASGAGLVRAMCDRTLPQVLSVIGEFGLRLSAISNPRANSAEMGLRSALLDFFSKSGQGKVLSPVAYSDNTKNTALLQSPALSILGVSTPETFFEKLSEASVSDGLIPRFLTISCEGECKISNKQRKTDPDPALINSLISAAEASLYMSRNNSFYHIPLDHHAQKRFDEFEQHIVSRMNSYPDGAIRNILNRAHLKALRLAGLAATLDDPKAPKVMLATAKWAIEFTEADCAYMLARFEKGYVGEGENRQLSMIREKIHQLLDPERTPISNPKWRQMLELGVMPYSLLSQKLISMSAFENDRRGATAAINACLKNLCDTGEIQEVSAAQLKEEFNATGRAYMISTMMKDDD